MDKRLHQRLYQLSLLHSLANHFCRITNRPVELSQSPFHKQLSKTSDSTTENQARKESKPERIIFIHV